MPKQKKAPRWCYWRGDVLWCRFTVNDHQVRESLRTSSIEIARKRAEQIRAKAIGASRFDEAIRTWEDALSSWAAVIGDSIGERTVIRYDQSIRAVSKYLTGKPIRDIGMRDINGLVAARKTDGVTIATIRRDLTAVSSVLDHAVDELWREGNPARDKARRLKEVKKQFILPSVDNIEAVLAPMTGAMEDMARLSWLTGMRLSEITALDRRQIQGRLLHFRGKGDKGRTIELPPEALAIIARQPIAIGTALVFHHDGDRYRNLSSNFSRAVRKAQKAAQNSKQDFTFFTFHGLRHIFAIEALRSGLFGLYELSRHLGHGSVQITEDTYLEYLTPEQAKKSKDGTRRDTRATVASVPK